jgi:FlaA1/EpsC-like NDP-sugar epimerase
MFSLEDFIARSVTRRQESLFLKDIQAHRAELSAAIKGKSLLVIGGAGSIGSSFIKACLPYEPASLVVVDISENALAELTRDLRSTEGLPVPADYIPYPLNYADGAFRKMFLARGGFDIVANFSAHKHVRSEKDIYSVEALIQNNLLHARQLLELLSACPPEKFFCVSTDKAANPVNIMGASKRIMEDLIFSYSEKFPVTTARFANVAFSNGSLPAGFLERIRKLQPISAPSDVKRYFVSPQESGQICMLACMLGKNREIYFPKLDEASMMTFSDIATELLEAQGYHVLQCASDAEAVEKAAQLRAGGRDYPVHYSGSDTTGEKAFEEFFTESEHVDMQQFTSLGVIKDIPLPDSARLSSLFSGLEAAFARTDTSKEDIVCQLSSYLPNFVHEEKHKSLDAKM